MSHFRERRAGTEIGAGHQAALDRPVVAGRRMPRGTKAAGATPGSAELRRSQRGTHAVPTRRFPSHRALPHAQEAALDAIANVLIMHLEEKRERSTHASAPVLIQVDGPGGPDLVEMVADCVRKHLTEDERGSETGDVGPPATAGDQPARRPPLSPWYVIRAD